MGKARIPNYFFSTDHAPLSFAGLWETWKSPDGEHIKSFTILTTKANQLIQPIHDRMPVILSGETQALWLDPLTEDTEVLGKLLTPAPDEDLDVYQVSDLVNSPKTMYLSVFNRLPEGPIPLRLGCCDEGVGPQSPQRPSWPGAYTQIDA